MESPCLSRSDKHLLLLSKVDTLVDGSIKEFLDTGSIPVASTMVPRECLHVAVLISLNSQYVGPFKEGKSVGRYLGYVSRKQSGGNTSYPHHALLA